MKAGSLPTIVAAPNSAGRWFCHQYSLSDHGKSEWALIMDMAEVRRENSANIRDGNKNSIVRFS